MDVVDVYIVFGILSGAILLATVVCLLIYCHWHRNHVKKPGTPQQTIFMSRSEECKSTEPSHRLNFKRIFRFKKRPKVVSKDQRLSKNPIDHLEYQEIEENAAEIDLSSSIIELVVHRPDGTLQRKKYRNSDPSQKWTTNCAPRDTPNKCPSLRPPSIAPSVPLSFRNSLAHSARSYGSSQPISEYGYIVALKRDAEKPTSTVDRVGSVDFAPSRRTDLMPPGHSLKRADFCILVTKDELDSQSQTDFVKRHNSAPARHPADITDLFGENLDNSNTISPIYSNSSGYSSAAPSSPPAPTPNEIRNLTKRIAEIHSQQLNQKRFVRYNSLPNYRLCHDKIIETEEE